MKRNQQPAQSTPSGMTAPKKAKGRRNPSDAYASARAAKLDQQTPKWPELRVNISDSHSTISASGITHDLAGDDPQSAAVTFAADQARKNGKPIRMTATMATGDVHRMIVAPDRSVVLLDHARPAGAAPVNPPAAAGGKKTRSSRRKASSGRPKKTTGIVGRFPARLQPIIKWGAPAFVVILVVLLVALVLKGPKHPAAAGSAVAQQDHPAPPAGTLYTVTAPPGWSQTATWTVALADQSIPYTDPTTGVTAALTPDDRTTAQTAHDTAGNIEGHKANYLSVLSPDGSTRFAELLTTTPAYGPVITTVDGAKVVLLQESSSAVTYWPIGGGQASTVNLPDGVSGQLNTTGPSVMVALGDQRVAYLHRGAFQTLEALPLTTPMFAVDGSVVSVQPETGAWWSQRIDASPTSIKPTPPAGAQGIDQVLAITPDHAVISWKTTAPAGSYSAPDLVAAYDAAGKLIAQAISDIALTPAQTVYFNAQHGLTAADGFVLSTPAGQPAKLTLVNGLQVAAVYDAVYGQDQGQPAVINAAGTANQLPTSALTPVGASTDHLMIASQNQLYALPADPAHTAASLPVITTVGATTPTPPPTAATTTAPAVPTTAPTKPAPPNTTAKVTPKVTPKVIPKTTAKVTKPAAPNTTPAVTPKKVAPTPTTKKIAPTTTRVATRTPPTTNPPAKKP